MTNEELEAWERASTAAFGSPDPTSYDPDKHQLTVEELMPGSSPIAPEDRINPAERDAGHPGNRFTDESNPQ